MRRAFTWGLPVYAAVMTGIFIGRSLPDNNLRAGEDVVSNNNVKAIAPATTSLPPSPPNGSGSSYPIPAPLAQPKHLFHFVIRYEGDGLSDPGMLATALAAASDIPMSGPKKADKSNVAKLKAPDLFQFIVRYEGDGIVDDNVAKVLKDYFTAMMNENAPAATITTGTPPSGAAPSPVPEPRKRGASARPEPRAESVNTPFFAIPASAGVVPRGSDGVPTQLPGTVTRAPAPRSSPPTKLPPASK